MYNEHFGFAESPFNVTPDSRFLFVNPCYEEAFATLRYGIDARKGFIVVTGEPGTGKTTLLKRLTQSTESNVHTACVFDPHLSFTEILKLILADLGLSRSGEDRLTMMGQLYDYLIEQLERGQIVALMIDEAQSVSEEVLEELRLLSNLETDTEKLIQIILVGQPEFEAKLDQPEFDHLRQRVTLRCRLRPLEKHDIGLYIESRLRTVNCRRRDLFDAESIERIALYSKGIPRLINVICDNALLIAYANNRGYITVGDIDEAAHELQLIDHIPTAPDTALREFPIREFSKTEDGDDHPSVSNRQTGDARTISDSIRPLTSEKPNGVKVSEKPRGAPPPEPPRPEFEPFFVELGWNKPASVHSRSMGILIFLCMVAGTALFIGVQQREISVPAMGALIERLLDLGRGDENLHPAPPSATHPEKSNDAVSQRAPVADAPPLVAQNLDEDITPAPEPKEQVEPALPLIGKEVSPSKKSADIRQNKRAVFKDQAALKPANEAVIPDRKLELEIYKAINDRAIRGVQVSYVEEGTVYLEGRVATPRQKLAAVRAALGVHGVKRVRDRIVIDY